MKKTKKQSSNAVPSKTSKSIPRLFFTGFAMGSADIVPGVSGGTIALILGVYEELIESIKSTSGVSLKLFLSGKIKEAILSVPWKFLIPLATGLFTAVVTLAKFLEFMLLNHPVYVWAFFFGLVLASIVIVGKKVKTWDAQKIGSLILATIFAYIVVGAVPVETPNNYLAFFVSGAIAICAMILPGISGSFLLVIMGKYGQILTAVTERDIIRLGIFMAGAVVGLALFSRLLSWLFARYHDLIMAILVGVMIGSLRKIWPWKEVVQTYVDSHGVEMPLVEKNIMPIAFDQTVFFAICLAVIAIAIISYVSRYEE